MSIVPVSAGIILVSILLAFGRSPLYSSFVSVVANYVSLVSNTILTWISVKSGLYMLSRSLVTKANKLKDKETKITGQMKANVMWEKNNLERMKAASTMRSIATMKNTRAASRLDLGGGVNRGHEGGLDRGKGGAGFGDKNGTGSGVATPRTPTAFSPLVSGNPASPFMGRRRSAGRDLMDVELGHRTMGSSQVYLVPERR